MPDFLLRSEKASSALKISAGEVFFFKLLFCLQEGSNNRKKQATGKINDNFFNSFFHFYVRKKAKVFFNTLAKTGNITCLIGQKP